MNVSIDKLNLVFPPQFLVEESSACWRMPSKPGAKMPEVRPNIIVQRRVVANADLAKQVSAIAAELVRRVDGISTIETTDFRFADGATGFLLKYALAGPGTKLGQLQAARLDGNVLTTLLLTFEVTSDTAHIEEFLTCLASATVAGGAL